MRFLFFILVFVFVIIFGCTVTTKKDKVVIYDTVSVFDTIPVLTCDAMFPDTFFIPCGHEGLIDTLSARLFRAEYKIERVKYYLNLAQNKSQEQFLKGWIKRSIWD